MNKRILALSLVGCSLLVVIFVALTVFDRGAQGQQEAPKRFSEVPEIVSQVRELELVQADLRDGGTTNALVNLKIKNTSDKAIIALCLESGDEKDASGTNLNGIHDGDVTPSIVARPHETFEVAFPLSNVLPGFPLRIAAVMYADGSEAGDERALKSMRNQKEHRKSKTNEGPR